MLSPTFRLAQLLSEQLRHAAQSSVLDAKYIHADIVDEICSFVDAPTLAVMSAVCQVCAILPCSSIEATAGSGLTLRRLRPSPVSEKISPMQEWRTTAQNEKRWAKRLKADFGLSLTEMKPMPASARLFYLKVARVRSHGLRGAQESSDMRALHKAMNAQLHPAALMGALVGRDTRMMMAAASLGYRFR